MWYEIVAFWAVAIGFGVLVGILLGKLTYEEGSPQ